MSQQGSSATGNGKLIARIWRFLTEPSPEIQRLEDRRQAEFLSALLVLMTPVTLFAAAVPSPSQMGLPTWAGTFVPLASFFAAVVIYVLSRTRRYRTAINLTITLASVIIFFAIIMDDDPIYPEAVFYLLVPVLLSSVLMSARKTVIVVVLQSLALLLVPVFLPGINHATHLTDPFMFYVIMSILVLLFTNHRDLVERDRRAHLDAEQKNLEAAYNNLENRIAERTAELSSLNERLRQQMAERERAEASLVEERNMLRALIEHIPDLVFVLDTNLAYMLNNAAHRQQLGVQTLEEVVGKTSFDFFPKAEAEIFSQEERKVIETGQPSLNFQTRYVDPAGQQRWAVTNRVPFRNNQGSVISLVGVVHDITDLKQAEAILRQTYNRSEQRLSVQNMELAHAYSRLWYQANLLENVSEAIVATDMNGVIQSWNHAAEICYGRKAEEAIGQNWTILQEHLAEEQTRALNDSLAAGRAWQGELSFRHKNGQSLHFMVSISFIHDYYEGEPSGIVAVSRDITERKKVEAAEREQRLFAEALRDTAAAINSTLELNEVLDRIFLHITRIVPCDMANVSLVKGGMSQVVRYWGTLDKRAEQEIFTMPFEVDQTPTLKSMVETQQPIFVPDTDHFQGWVRKGIVNIRSYMGVPIIIQGEVIGFLNISSFQPHRFEEIHIERMRAFAEQVAIAMRNAQLYETIRNHAAELVQHVAYRTAELERERTQLQIILDSMSDGVVSSVLNDMGALRPIYVNPALKQLLGYDLEDWHNQMVMNQIMAEADNPTLYQQVFEAIATRGHWHGEATLRRKDGSEFRAFVSSSRVNNPEGFFIGVVTVIRDISQEKALQEQRSRFVANASHELRTPITNLMTRLWLLRKQPERLDEHLVILEEVANRMRYLVEDLLDVSRLERGTIPLDTQDMDLRAVIESVVQLQQAEAEQKQIRLEGHLPDAPLIIRGDHRRVHQVITNLVINAINYTSSGGRVDVEAAVKPDADSQTNYVIIGIRDSGVGIPPEHLEHLFQPFYRIGEQGKGTGLGLAIAREIVRMHGGDIFVESEVGKGSCFNVRFALRNQPMVSDNNL